MAGRNLKLSDRGELQLHETFSTSSHKALSIKAPSSLTASVTLTLPDGAGSASQYLQTDGAGTLSWVNGAATLQQAYDAGQTIDLVSDIVVTQSTGDKALTINKSHTGADNIIDLNNSGSGDAIQITQNGAGLALDINHGAANDVLDISKSDTGSGDVLKIKNSGSGDAIEITQEGAGISVNIDKTDTGSDNVIDITNSGSGKDIQGNSGNWHIDKAGEISAREVILTQDTADEAININKTDTGSENVIEISNSGSGKDIQGNSGNWHVDKAGDATFNDVTVNSIIGSNTLVPTGSVTAFMGTSAPSGWLMCDGSAVSRSTYSALYSVVGNASGSGDGSTTFNLPDMRGKFLRGVDNGAGQDPDDTSRTADASGGNTGDNVGSIQGDEFDSHDHSASVSGPNNVLREYRYSGDWCSSSSDNLARSESATPSVNIGNTGGNETRPKNVNVNYIIKT